MESVAQSEGTGVRHASLVDGILDLGDEQTRAEAFDVAVAVGEDLGEVLAGVDVQDREGKLLGREGLGRQVQQDRRILTAREQQDGSLALGDDFSQDEHGVGFEQVEMIGHKGGLEGVGSHRGSGSLVILLNHVTC